MLASSIFPSGSISTDNSTNQSTPDLRKKKKDFHPTPITIVLS